MKRQYVITLIVAAVVLLLIGAGALIYGLSQGGSIPGLGTEPTPSLAEATFTIPDIKVTPPPSLTEIAGELRAEYPELADLLENPELGSVYKDFYLAYSRGGEQTALALARQRGLLNDQDQIIMTLVLDTDDSAGLITELESEGVIVLEHYRNLISIAIPVSLVQEQIKAEEPNLIVERISNLDHVIRLELPNKATIKKDNRQGQILGQGVNVTFASTWHAQNITGQGVKVGVLDLGFAGYENLLGNELPDNVTIKAFGDRSQLDVEVHGTACAEIVHEMAPDAEIVLAYYDGTDVAMGRAIEWLQSQNVDIITNSTGSNGLTPLDGSGFINEIVDAVHDGGILWVNAAGNEATSHYRGQYSDADGNTLHNFFPDAEVIPFIPYGPGYETSVILSWNDWQVVDQDYDLILLDADGNILGKSEDYQDGQPGAMPVEGFFYEFDDSEIYLMMIENSGGLARGDAVFDLFIHNGELHPDYLVAEGSLGNPADARGALAVGAVHWSDDVLEPYSSQGPTADGRIKPDIAAPSVVDSASYTPEAFNGTSAAAPHVAGAAALVLQAFPDFSPSEVTAFLQERSIDLGPAGADNAFGAGRLNLGAAPGEPAEPEETPPPPAEVEVLPTSTPRPVADVGLPGQTGLPGQSAPPATEEENSALGIIILGGLCLICVSGILLLVLAVAGVVLMRGKK